MLNALRYVPQPYKQQIGKSMPGPYEVAATSIPFYR